MTIYRDYDKMAHLVELIPRAAELVKGSVDSFFKSIPVTI